MFRPRTLSLAPGLTIVTSLFLCDQFLGSQTTIAASQTQLVPLLTNQTALPLSNVFGVPPQGTVNQSGDYAFIGNGGSGLYYRGAGAAAPTPVLLMGDEVPGFPGS